MIIFTMAKKYKLFLLIFLFGNIFIFGQSNLNIGGYFGGGVISGNFTNQGSFTSSVFIDFNPGFSSNLSTRLSFIYSSDFNALVPGNVYPYNPTIKGYSLKLVTWQGLSDPFYLEEGVGPLALNDRTFIGLNTWDYGLVFSIIWGIDFRQGNTTGFRLGAGTEYGLTITNTHVRYISFHVQAQYFL